jgi:hypothetical protein
MLFIIPYGGLGNRLMAMMSARVLAEHLGCPLQLVWRMHLNLEKSNYPISALFQGIDSIHLAETEPRGGFNHHHHTPGPVPEVEAKLRAGETVYLHSYCFIRPVGMVPGEFTEKIHRQFEGLKPLPEVLKRIPALPDGTIGVHVRRGDNWRATRYSPLRLFFLIMDRDCDIQTDQHFFLATDSPSVKHEMRRRYGQRIVTLENQISHSAQDEAQSALVDILALTRTSKIYCSFMSSFGFAAHLISRRPYFCVSLSRVKRSWYDSPWNDLHDRLIVWDPVTSVWQQRRLPDASAVTRIQANALFYWNRFVCSNFYQMWPYHPMRAVDDSIAFEPPRRNDAAGC